MKKFKVVGAYISVHSGIVELTKSQASARAYALTDLKKPGQLISDSQQYAVHTPTGFKLGEVFGWDEEIGKGLDHIIQDADAPAEGAPEEKPKGNKGNKGNKGKK